MNSYPRQHSHAMRMYDDTGSNHLQHLDIHQEHNQHKDDHLSREEVQNNHQQGMPCGI